MDDDCLRPQWYTQFGSSRRVYRREATPTGGPDTIHVWMQERKLKPEFVWNRKSSRSILKRIAKRNECLLGAVLSSQNEEISVSVFT